MSAYPAVAVAPARGPDGSAAPLERLLSAEPDSICRLVRAASRFPGDAAPIDCSDLTAVGAPLEVGFVWPRGEVRVTIDPCPLGTPLKRVAACRQAVAGILTRWQEAVADVAAFWQGQHETRFGAWLGLRIRGSNIRRKLYLDLPHTAPWGPWEREVIGKPAVLPHRDVRATMLGLDGDRGGLEIYYRCGSLFPAELGTLMRRFGLAERGAEIASTVQALTQRTIRGELPSSNMGFSCALAENGLAQAFTWYSTSRALLGPASRARQALLRVGCANGWDLKRYAALTVPDADATVPHHGLVGMTIPRDGPMQVTATVAAVPLCAQRDPGAASVGEGR